MDIKYNVSKIKGSKEEIVKDAVSVEEPLEMRLKYKKNGKIETQNISITMRTPGNDEDLIRGFLFNERIIENMDEIDSIQHIGDPVGDYNLHNVIEATVNKIDNLDIGKLKRNFVTNSSCGVCGKTSLDSIEVLKNDKLDSHFPKIKEEIILKCPSLLMNEQSEFAKTGGIHASALIDEAGSVIATREDVGRHNALDKLLGHTIQNGLLNIKAQFIACSGRLNFELVQKGLMANIGIMAGVGAPTSLAVDLAKRFDMTLLGFVKESSFNIYNNKKRIILS
ncbi:formate dehydrogenase accessory sulfurtransferase FdhD [Candidatus Pelagibacter sp.]|nr:formate dehydrogenase accessory sulfurtransferase FdhD [Candidatus Pelagibacter sp.]